MGLADIATVLSKHLNINPADEKWLNRDRLVFSGGHATGLVYSLLHLWGFDVSVNDMKNFRQSGSKNSRTSRIWAYSWNRNYNRTTRTRNCKCSWICNGRKICSKFIRKDVINHKVYCLCGE